MRLNNIGMFIITQSNSASSVTSNEDIIFCCRLQRCSFNSRSQTPHDEHFY